MVCLWLSFKENCFLGPPTFWLYLGCLGRVFFSASRGCWPECLWSDPGCRSPVRGPSENQQHHHWLLCTWQESEKKKVEILRESQSTNVKVYTVLSRFNVFQCGGLSHLMYDFCQPSLRQGRRRLILFSDLLGLSGPFYVESTKNGTQCTAFINPWSSNQVVGLRGSRNS